MCGSISLQVWCSSKWFFWTPLAYIAKTTQPVFQHYTRINYLYPFYIHIQHFLDKLSACARVLTLGLRGSSHRNPSNFWSRTPPLMLKNWTIFLAYLNLQTDPNIWVEVWTLDIQNNPLSNYFGLFHHWSSDTTNDNNLIMSSIGPNKQPIKAQLNRPTPPWGLKHRMELEENENIVHTSYRTYLIGGSIFNSPSSSNKWSFHCRKQKQVNIFWSDTVCGTMN